MKFIETAVKGAYVVELDAIRDERGFFARAWCAEEFREMGIDPTFVQANLSMSLSKGTIRGLHYLRPPYLEQKFVRCTKGSLYDVIVDLREDSPTFQRWTGNVIGASDHRAVYVPAGCAHGVLTLEDRTEMLYMVGEEFHREAEGGIRWDDPFFAIDWPETETKVVSEKDCSWPDYQPISVHP